MPFKSGFVSVIGNPNVGKSTLMNALLGQKLSIITHKAQTTRHRILGILNGENFQIVFSDLPGVIKPVYKMQELMMQTVKKSLDDSDVLIFITDGAPTGLNDIELVGIMKKSELPLLVIINKTDRLDEKKSDELKIYWTKEFPGAKVVAISALKQTNLDVLIQEIISLLPEGKPYYPEDTLTDRSERFFVSEIIREKILLNFHQEVPYSCEVQIEAFEDQEKHAHINASVFVMRESQKTILIGKKGDSIKRLGIQAREAIEDFLRKKIYLELHVKVRKDWRENERMLKGFGY